ncbi:hypothetical protein GALL_450390 [mine drainage metagenome]|uniref:Uncharacterized protein n=1 Tax=mine drainage metagenome TaxID=410659 RepID=A0A1J5PQB2_9ZZZZ
MNQTAVVYQCVDQAFIDCNIEQAIARHIERHGAASGQCHAAQLCRNHAVVTDRCPQQRHIAAIGVDAALIDHGARAMTSQLEISRQKVTVRDVQGRGQQTTHIDRCALAKKDAVGVDQEHLAIGIQIAKNA